MSNTENILILVSGASTTAAIVYFIRNNKIQKKLEKQNRYIEKLNSQLASLEVENATIRLNPHLLKNTLNTIYSYSWQTTNAIEKLSEMLKYILNESKNKYVTLSEEIEFLKAYYEVHKSKLSPLTKCNINFSTGKKGEALKIAPLITINFIENAFIHGDYVKSESFFDIEIIVENNELTYRVSNTFTKSESSTGIGNENFKKRLDLLHKGKYQINIEPSENSYTATLKLKLDEN